MLTGTNLQTGTNLHFQETSKEGKRLNCKNIYKLTSGAFYDIVTRHENIHITNANKADVFIQGRLNKVSGKFYKIESECDIQAQASDNALKNWWAIFSNREAMHIGKNRCHSLFFK